MGQVPAEHALSGPGSNWGGGTSTWKNGGASADTAVYKAWLADAKSLAALKNAGGSLTPANVMSLGITVPVSAKSGGLRPTFVECANCTNFMVDGVTITGAWYWVVHPLYSKNVIVRNATIDSSTSGSNGDGTDPDSSDDVLIDNVAYTTSDDMIALKSGTNEVGFNIAHPTHDVVAHNIKVSSGHGFSIGSELSGGVNNVYEYNDTKQSWSGTTFSLRIKSPSGRGAVDIANVWFEDVTSSAPLLITNSYGSATIAGSSALGTPTYSNINLVNVTCGGTSSCTVKTNQTSCTGCTGGGC